MLIVFRLLRLDDQGLDHLEELLADSIEDGVAAAGDIIRIVRHL